MARQNIDNPNIGTVFDFLNDAVKSSQTKLNDALNAMQASDDVGPEQLLLVQRETNIWTTFVSQTTTMAKAITDTCKSVVRNYN